MCLRLFFRNEKNDRNIKYIQAGERIYPENNFLEEKKV